MKHSLPILMNSQVNLALFTLPAPHPDSCLMHVCLPCNGQHFRQLGC